MNIRWIGAVLIIAGSGGFGFAMASAYRREEKSLKQLLIMLDYMCCELEFRRTPLPELCRKLASQGNGAVHRVFFGLAQELDRQIAPDAACCMEVILQKAIDVPKRTKVALEAMGRSLGAFDISGQLLQLNAVEESCRKELERLQSGKEDRLRNYQTLGLCAGAAVAILLI